jgi:hypothetical protein
LAATGCAKRNGRRKRCSPYLGRTESKEDEEEEERYRLLLVLAIYWRVGETNKLISHVGSLFVRSFKQTTDKCRNLKS